MKYKHPFECGRCRHVFTHRNDLRVMIMSIVGSLLSLFFAWLFFVVHVPIVGTLGIIGFFWCCSLAINATKQPRCPVCDNVDSIRIYEGSKIGGRTILYESRDDHDY